MVVLVVVSLVTQTEQIAITTRNAITIDKTQVRMLIIELTGIDQVVLRRRYLELLSAARKAASTSACNVGLNGNLKVIITRTAPVRPDRADRTESSLERWQTILI